MKKIESIQIWNNGKIKTASVLNAKANVNLNNDANFDYYLYSINEIENIVDCVATGNLYMNSEIYATWTQDDIAWDFIAKSLNLVITGDYVAPQPIVKQVNPIEEQIIPQE